ncbi:hypothetical protein FTX61_17760 [Nitriliruptoraceae bacterium ZYF776]|nr:hypothetical protein [Profundirhabdus halotolerans]
MLLQRKRVAFTLVLALALAGALVPFSVQAETRAPAWVDGEAEFELSVSSENNLRGLPEADGGSPSAAEAIEAPITFSSVWVQLPDEADAVELRVSLDGATWTEWTELERVELMDTADPGSDESEAIGTPEITDPYFADVARFVEVRGAVEGAYRLHFVDTEGLNESTIARLARHLFPEVRTLSAEASSLPSWIKPRSAWRAAAPSGNLSRSSNGVQRVVVHHTATPNEYTAAQVPARIRNMQAHHMKPTREGGLGAYDIGYNILIDRFGQVWEGRAGGLDQAIAGAHAGGYNTGSTGVSVIGNFVSTAPSATILRALDRVVGWQAGIYGIDTTGIEAGTSRPTVIGHRDVGNTACPGLIQNHLGRIRANAASHAGGYSGFRDIAGSPHEQAIRDLVDREITQGYDDRTFRPSNDVTRAQVATFLGRALELSPSTGSAFRDVGGSPHEGYIYALVEAGILNGYGDTFRPNEPLRREHMAAILTRALELDLDPAAGGAFSDVRGYVGEIGALRTAGITGGCGTNPLRYCPESSVTRGQMATFLMNALGHLEAGTRPVADDGALEPAAETT